MRVAVSALPALLALGLVEWHAAVGFTGGLRAADVGRGLLGVAVIYGAAGLGAVLLALAVGRETPGAAVAAGLLAFVRALVAGGGHTQQLAALALALAVVWAVRALLRRLPLFARPSVWWTLVVVGFAGALALEPATRSDPVARHLALGASAVAAVLGLAAWAARSRGLRAALALAALAAPLAASGAIATRVPVIQPDVQSPADGPSVVLVTIDTLRADHVGAYGDASARTGTLDALAKRGVLFEQAVTATVWTGPSHASIFTGRNPWHHGVRLNAQRLGDTPTLAESFRARGYVTAAFIGGYTATDSSLGIASRFHHFDDDMRRVRVLPELASKALTLVAAGEALLVRAGRLPSSQWQSYRQADSLTGPASAWLKANGRRKFFVWVHLFDPHLPYLPPPSYRAAEDRDAQGDFFRMNARERAALIRSPERVAQMLRLYDDEIAFADHELGQILAAAQAAVGTRPLVVAVLADHGEAFGEHGLYWNRELYDESLRVPLIIAGGAASAQPGRRIPGLVRTIDLAPTLLELCGLPPLEHADGKSLASLLGDGEPEPAPPALSAQYRYDDDFHRPSFSIRTESWKLIAKPEGWRGGSLGGWDSASEELYDLVHDPRELADRRVDDAATADQLRPLLGEIGTLGGAAALTPEQRRALRALGYVE